jgi:hypothetical protein
MTIHTPTSYIVGRDLSFPQFSFRQQEGDEGLENGVQKILSLELFPHYLQSKFLSL